MRKYSWRSAFLFCLCITLALTVYCIALNRLYYARFGPFFDSLAYLNLLANVYSVALSHGFVNAMRASSGTTVALPWMVEAAIARWVPLSRTFGVYFQCGLLLLSILSVWNFLTAGARWRSRDACLAVVALVSLRCLYAANAGLSNFRMDLGFYLMVLCTLAWVLTALQRDSLYAWCAAGVAAGLACLVRATAPPFLCAMLVPLIVAQLLLSPDRSMANIRRAIGGACIMGVICFAVAGWMYVTRWHQLEWYYLVWNRDANAKSPILNSLTFHLRRAIGDIGVPALCVLALFAMFGPAGLLRKIDGIKLNPRTYMRGLAHRMRMIRWELLLAAAGPILLLGLRGAGNTFVSMPAAAAFSLFCLCPQRGNTPSTGFALGGHRASTLAVSIGIAAIWMFAALNGLGDHLRDQGGQNPMSAQIQVADRILSRCPPHRRIVFTTAAFAPVNNQSLRNVLIYNDGFLPSTHGLVRGPINLAIDRTFEPTEPVEWASLPGQTDAEKINQLSQRAASSVDCMILSDAPTALYLQRHGFESEINRHAVAVRNSILSHGRWERVGAPIVESEHVVVWVLWNKH